MQKPRKSQYFMPMPMPNNILAIRKYRFTLKAIDPLNLPAYKGSTFHGGFGHALQKLSPTWYRYFFEPGDNSSDKQNDWPKPFVILPPPGESKTWPQGHRFHCELTLFGAAIQHHAICQAAIEYLGAKMGLGHQKGKYRVVDIQQSQPELVNTPTLSLSPDEPTSFRHPHAGEDPDPTHNSQQITLHFTTRLRLKTNNRLCKQPPTFHQLMTRLLGRLKTLDQAYSPTPANTDHHQALLAQARNIHIQHSTLHWDDWSRFSGRQKNWMNFGGLLGEITYSGDLVPFMPYLRLGEWLHIGGKSSFGLGKYEMEMK